MGNLFSTEDRHISNETDETYRINRQRQKESIEEELKIQASLYLKNDINFLIQIANNLIGRINNLRERYIDENDDLFKGTNKRSGMLYEFILLSISELINDPANLSSHVKLLNKIALRLNKLKDQDIYSTREQLFLLYCNIGNHPEEIEECKSCCNPKLYDSEFCYEHLDIKYSECCICSEDRKLTTLPCKHGVCYECYDFITLCPLCRASLNKNMNINTNTDIKKETINPINKADYQKIIETLVAIRKVNHSCK